MAEINVTPLVDVMLVLLIIFMITAPLMSHKIKIELPQANPATSRTTIRRQPITLSVKENGEMYWNDEPITEATLQASCVSPRSGRRSRNCRSAPTRTREYQLIAR